MPGFDGIVDIGRAQYPYLFIVQATDQAMQELGMASR